MNRIVDTKGKNCPLPIILTKKCINESILGDHIEVLLDNTTSKCNLIQYLTDMGIECSEINLGEHYSISFTLTNEIESTEPEKVTCPIELQMVRSIITDHIIAIKSNQMGVGEPELGETLIRSYINSLTDLDTLPKMIIFYNSGVKLLDKNSDTIQTLKEIEQMGVQIIACGVCSDFYDITLGVGTISNMFKIGNSLAKTQKIIYP